jgi:GR25 family glycosyltransferase involved in LPS biosynthesis
MVHLYVINLDKDIERWNKIQKQLLMFNSTSFIPQKISAVVGKKLDLKGLNMSIRTKACIDEPRCGHESINTMGEIGCYLSHYNVWKEFLNTKDEYCIICEDDIVFEKKILDINVLYEKVKSFLSTENDPPIAIFLTIMSIFYDKKNIKELPELWRATGRFFGTACYLINRSMANFLVKNAFPIEVQVDSYIAFLSKLNKNIYIYHAIEPYAKLTNDQSTLEHTDCKGCYLPVTRKFVVGVGIIVLIILILAILVVFFKKCKNRHRK